MDEEVVAHPQVPAEARGSRGGRLVIHQLLLGGGLAGLLGSSLAGLPGGPLGGVFSSAFGGLLGGDLVGLRCGILGNIIDDGIYVLRFH